MARRAHNEGTIYKHKATGKWSAQHSVEGKRITRYFTTQTDARLWLTEQRHLAGQGMITPKGDQILVGDHLKRWLESAGPSLRPKTVASYESVIRLHLVGLAKHKLGALRPDQVQKFYGDKLVAGCSPRLVQLCHAVLHRSLHMAVRWGLVPRNVADAVDVPQPERRHKVQAWSAQEVGRFLSYLESAGSRHLSLFTLAVTTGLRLGELLGLHWEDLDLDAGKLAVRRQIQHLTGRGTVEAEPKTSRSRRTIILSRRAREALRVWRTRQKEDRLLAGDRWTQTPYVFTSRTGTPHIGTNIRSDFKAACAKADVPLIRLHDLRHTCATLMFEAKQHPKLVSDILGHSQVSMTLDIYSHAVPTMHDQAAAAMDELLDGADARSALAAAT